MTAVCVVLVLIASLRWFFIPYRIDGDSMSPTLHGGSAADVVLVSRASYWGGVPGRGDVVVLDGRRLPGRAAGSLDRVKRVVGLPGETVEIRDGRVWIDGMPLADEVAMAPGAEAGFTSSAGPSAGVQAPFVVRKGRYGHQRVELGPDEFYVLGDNSGPSWDSRLWGPVPRDAVSGRVVWVVQPWGRWGRVR